MVGTEVRVEWSGSRAGRERRAVDAEDYVDGWSIHPEGLTILANVRGRMFSMGLWDGPALEYAPVSEHDPNVEVAGSIPPELAPPGAAQLRGSSRRTARSPGAGSGANLGTVDASRWSRTLRGEDDVEIHSEDGDRRKRRACGAPRGVGPRGRDGRARSPLGDRGCEPPGERCSRRRRDGKSSHGGFFRRIRARRRPRVVAVRELAGVHEVRRPGAFAGSNPGRAKRRGSRRDRAGARRLRSELGSRRRVRGRLCARRPGADVRLRAVRAVVSRDTRPHAIALRADVPNPLLRELRPPHDSESSSGGSVDESESDSDSDDATKPTTPTRTLRNPSRSISTASPSASSRCPCPRVRTRTSPRWTTVSSW